MKIEELDAVLDLHIEGLGHELDLLRQILDYKSVDLSGRAHLKKVLYHMLATGEGCIFVAAAGDKYIGYCLVTKKVYPIEKPKTCGTVNGIYIRESHRGQGLGRKLFAAAAAWLKAGHVTNIELYHMINDAGAKKFWEKMGFVPIQLNCARKI